MPVTDNEVAVLRAYLCGDQALQQELQAGLVSPGARTRYATLVAAAFFEAVDRRFAADGTAADVIAYVADVRARSEQVAAGIDPQAAERLIRSALTEEDVFDLDAETRGGIFIVVLMALVSDEHFSGDELDAFLAEARKTADGWLDR